MLKKLLIIILLLIIPINVFAETETISTLINALEESTELIQELQQAIIEKDNSISLYEKQINDLIQRIEESNLVIEELRNRIVKDQEEINDLELSISSLQDTVHDLLPLIDNTFYRFGASFNTENTILLHNVIKLPFFNLSLLSNVGFNINKTSINAGLGLLYSF